MLEHESRWLAGFNEAIQDVMLWRGTDEECATRDKIVARLISTYELQRSALCPEFMHKSHRPQLNEFC